MKNIRLNKNEYRLHKMAASAAFFIEIDFTKCNKRVNMRSTKENTCSQNDKEELRCLI